MIIVQYNKEAGGFIRRPLCCMADLLRIIINKTLKRLVDNNPNCTYTVYVMD